MQAGKLGNLFSAIFPNALGLIGQLLDLIIPGETPKAMMPVQRDRYALTA